MPSIEPSPEPSQVLSDGLSGTNGLYAKSAPHIRHTAMAASISERDQHRARVLEDEKDKKQTAKKGPKRCTRLCSNSGGWHINTRVIRCGACEARCCNPTRSPKGWLTTHTATEYLVIDGGRDDSLWPYYHMQKASCKKNVAALSVLICRVQYKRAGGWAMWLPENVLMFHPLSTMCSPMNVPDSLAPHSVITSNKLIGRVCMHVPIETL